MKTSDYRPLPQCLNHDCGANRRKRNMAGPPPGFELPPGFAEMMEQAKENERKRADFAECFRSGTSTWDGLTQPYRFYVPENLESGKRYPMVVFFHGAGEAGTDNLVQLTAYEGALVWVRDQLDGTGEPCFVLAPQMDAEAWVEQPLLAASKAIDDLMEKYPIDPARLYLTGMSMGGGAYWRINYMFPDRFAAVVPMCSACGMDENGNLDRETVNAAADAFIGKALWMFHAEDDMVVPVETTRMLASALEQRGEIRGRDFFFTEYPSEKRYNHGCWDPAYGDRTMRQWLMQQHL